uniref:Eclosion hormone n=1 Tax=Cacopsylla melanoneura TaxID=428564 RepID=A0A8D9BAT6_9HEMI
MLLYSISKMILLLLSLGTSLTMCYRLLSLLLSAMVLTSSLLTIAEANEIGVCIRNCAQCKKMLGLYFEGQLCAEACVKFKGKMIPDCENIDSISPFLNKLE